MSDARTELRDRIANQLRTATIETTDATFEDLADAVMKLFGSVTRREVAFATGGYPWVPMTDLYPKTHKEFSIFTHPQPLVAAVAEKAKP